MLTNENITVLYEKVIKGEKLSTGALKECGLSAYDINLLINRNVIIRIKRGEYEFIAVDDLCNYGVRLLKKGDCENARKCLLRCAMLDNKHESTLLQLFYLSIKESNYDDVIKYYKLLDSINNPKLRQELNLYLYLLSNIIDVPEEFLEYIRNINYHKIKIADDDERYSFIRKRNNFRINIMKKNFSIAFVTLKEIISNSDCTIIQDLIVLELLKKCGGRQKKDNNFELKMAINGQYRELQEFLLNQKERSRLTYEGKYYLILINHIFEVDESKTIPIPVKSNYKSIFNAINGCDFVSAYNLQVEFNKRLKFSNNRNIMFILLERLCSHIAEIITNGEANEYPNGAEFLQEYSLASSRIKQEKVPLESLSVNERNLLNDSYEKLIQGEMLVLLNPMEENKIMLLEKAVRCNYENMDAFMIDDFGKKRLALRYVNSNEELLDFNELISTGKRHYDNRRFSKCISCYSKLLQQKNVRGFIFTKIGFCYMQSGNVKKAIDFFKVANHLSKKYYLELDLEDLIMRLESPISKSEQKPRFYMSEEDFVDKPIADNKLDMQAIIKSIIQRGGNTYETCSALGLNNRQICVVMLHIAKVFFKQGDLKKGDEFLKYVEKIKNKDSVISRTLTEVRGSRKFLQDSNSSGDEVLPHYIKPIKN